MKFNLTESEVKNILEMHSKVKTTNKILKEDDKPGGKEQLQSFIETGANPPTAPPTEDQINSLKEPFTDGCCPQQLELLRQLTRDSKTRSLPNLASEINRLNTLLVNPILVVALAKCDSLLVRMSKIQTQLDKLKKGELYEWQNDGPSKSYEQFGGGDNTKALLFSLRQNQ